MFRINISCLLIRVFKINCISEIFFYPAAMNHLGNKILEEYFPVGV